LLPLSPDDRKLGSVGIYFPLSGPSSPVIWLSLPKKSEALSALTSLNPSSYRIRSFPIPGLTVTSGLQVGGAEKTEGCLLPGGDPLIQK